MCVCIEAQLIAGLAYAGEAKRACVIVFRIANFSNLFIVLLGNFESTIPEHKIDAILAIVVLVTLLKFMRRVTGSPPEVCPLKGYCVSIFVAFSK